MILYPTFARFKIAVIIQNGESITRVCLER